MVRLCTLLRGQLVGSQGGMLKLIVDFQDVCVFCGFFGRDHCMHDWLSDKMAVNH